MMTTYKFDYIEVNGVPYLTQDVTVVITANTTVVAKYVLVGGGGATGGSGNFVIGDPQMIKIYSSRPSK